MQAILEQLTQKIESFDSQLQTLTLTRSNPQPHENDFDRANYQPSSDQSASDEQSNQDYLKSLDTVKVHNYILYLSSYRSCSQHACIGVIYK